MPTRSRSRSTGSQSDDLYVTASPPYRCGWCTETADGKEPYLCRTSPHQDGFMALDPCTWASSFLKFSHTPCCSSAAVGYLGTDQQPKATRLAIRAVRSLAWRITFRFRPQRTQSPGPRFLFPASGAGRLLASLRSTQDE